jgi:hypothetical protein
MNEINTGDVVNSNLVKKDGRVSRILAWVLTPILLVVVVILVLYILTLFTPFIVATWF